MSMLSKAAADRIMAAIAVEPPTSGCHPIPVGTLVFHDHAVFRWPDNCNSEPTDPGMLFEIRQLRGGTIECTASGFGLQPNYGSGSLLIKLGHWRAAHGRAVTGDATKGDEP